MITTTVHHPGSTAAWPLKLEGITKRWQRTADPVLDGVDLVVEPGTAVLVEGANGAGKTTLLRIGAGLIRPDTGRVQLGPLDPDTDRTAFQRRTGFLSAASAGLYARLTVRDHLRFWSRLALLSRDDRTRCCRRVSDALDLAPLADRRVDRLSMGQRQRVRLAATFLHDPDLVLLDEPANSLDEEGLAVLASEVDLVRRRGGAALWCAPSGAPRPIAFDRRMKVDSGQLTAA
jgi:ABC-type multidrug transport system ATPase subunit